jgi:hypothetical protein
MTDGLLAYILADTTVFGEGARFGGYSDSSGRTQLVRKRKLDRK